VQLAQQKALAATFHAPENRFAMIIDLTILLENTAVNASLATEHGLAVHIAGGGRDFLLDTSATPEALSANAAALGIDLSALDGVIISHGHLDHVGGIDAVLKARPGLRVYAHPTVFAERFSDRAGQPAREIGWRSSPENLADRGAVFCPVPASQTLAEGIIISGPIPGPQPDIDRFLVKTASGQKRDEFADEVFLMLRGQSGWVVLTGCCHRGLPNTLRAARALAAAEPIAAIVGGFHLGPAGPAELAAAADAIEQVNPAAIYPCHCTGRPGREFLAKRFPGRVEQIHGGTRLSF